MDRALDDVISERHPRNRRIAPREYRNGGGGRDRGDRGDRGERNGDSREWGSQYNASDFDSDWVHDKYDDDPHARPSRRNRSREAVMDRYSSGRDSSRQEQAAKLRVDNLHYDLTEDDLEDLFTRIAPVLTLSLRYDRAGRSTGTAYVSYASVNAADRAIREFDGANAAGQPIRLTLLPSAPAGGHGGGGSRNPFDTAIAPGKSLFDRVEDPSASRRRRGDSRSRSPVAAGRRGDYDRSAPDGIDRYVPGGGGDRRNGGGGPRGGRRRSRSRSPPGGGRRRRSPPGPSRGRGGGGGAGGEGRGRRPPRKTQQELDQEMDDYFTANNSKAPESSTGAASAGAQQQQAAPAAPAPADDDIDMIS